MCLQLRCQCGVSVQLLKSSLQPVQRNIPLPQSVVNLSQSQLHLGDARTVSICSSGCLLKGEQCFGVSPQPSER